MQPTRHKPRAADAWPLGVTQMNLPRTGALFLAALAWVAALGVLGLNKFGVVVSETDALAWPLIALCAVASVLSCLLAGLNLGHLRYVTENVIGVLFSFPWVFYFGARAGHAVLG